jgi:type II secretory pathway component PulF
MQAAGLSLIRALDQLRNAPPSRSLVRPVQRLLDGLNQGLTFSEALKTLGRWLPSFDSALLAAGEQSGRTDTACTLLANYYANRAALARQVISALIYPAVILHAAIFLAPFPQLFLTGDFVTFARQTLGVLLPLYGLVWLAIMLCQSGHGEVWRAALERLSHPIPVLGKARRSLALARLAVALDALVNAGVPMADAWALAAAASGSPALRREVAGWKPRLLAGESPGDLLARARHFPSLFCNLYRTGEVSGTLDDTLERLRAYYEDEAQRKMKALAQWVPFAVYVLILILMAIRIISFWLNYYGGILDAVP